MIHLGRHAVTKARLAAHWPTTQAEIIESEVRKRPGSNARFRFKIKYAYEVEGQRYTGKNIAVGGEIRSSRIRAEKRQAQYPLGSIHPVFYNPQDAKDACLEPAVEGHGRMELFGGIVGMLIGLLVATRLIG